MMHRRSFGAGVVAALGAGAALPRLALAQPGAPIGTLGFYLLDTATGQGFGERMDERFAMCSSFKLSLAAHVLHLAQQGRIDLTQTVTYSEAFVAALGHAPDTKAHLSTGMSVLDLARASVVNSDNAAANLLLERSGGPEALTAFWRTLGDTTTRLDAIEPGLNRVPLGEVRNTSTPRAMAHTVAALLTGPLLTPAHRTMLLGWMHESATGLKRIRAGLPKDWWAGDKTGTASYDDAPAYCVDLAYIRPPGRKPLIATAFLRVDGPHAEITPAAEARIADAARAGLQRWMGQGHR
jgi:beta-lactamase class A